MIIMKLISLVKHPILNLRSIRCKLILGSFGKGARMEKPLRIDGSKNIYIDEGVAIQYGTWLACLPLTGEPECKLLIKRGSVIGHYNHIYSTKTIIINENVLTADKVYISDNLHSYDDVRMPVLKQPIIQNGIVEIGEGSWLGENVCVIGASIGKHCVIALCYWSK